MGHITPSLPVHHQLPKSTQSLSIESVMPSSHLILCCPLPLPPLIFPSIRIHVYLRLSLLTVHLKLSKHCKLAIPQCKILLVFKRKKKKWGFPGEIQGWDRESKDKCGTFWGPKSKELIETCLKKKRWKANQNGLSTDKSKTTQTTK